MAVETVDRIDLLTQTIASNHVETIERLTRLETALGTIPDRVEAIEHRYQRFSGALKLLSILSGAIGTLIGLFFKFKH